MLQTKIDFMLGILSVILQIDMRDHHNMPFALPLVMASVTGLTIGFVILKMIVKEQREDKLRDQHDSFE